MVDIDELWLMVSIFYIHYWFDYSNMVDSGEQNVWEWLKING